MSIMPGIDAREPERTETSSGCLSSPNLRPVFLATAASAFSTCAFRPSGNFARVRIVAVASLGGDGEARRHRQPERAHLGQIGALAAEQFAHRRIALGLAVAELVDPFGHSPAFPLPRLGLALPIVQCNRGFGAGSLPRRRQPQSLGPRDKPEGDECGWRTKPTIPFLVATVRGNDAAEPLAVPDPGRSSNAS